MVLKKFCFHGARYVVCIISIACTLSIETKNKEEKRDMRRRKHTQIFVKTSPAKKIEKLSYELTYEELKQKKDELVAFGNIESAVKIIEQMLRLSINMEVAASLLLELADLLYTNSQFESALNTYKNFIMHYEGHQQFEYALFKAIQCSSRLLLNFDRDQTQTEETLALIDKYLSLDHCVVHKGDVEQIRNDCIARLFSSEMYTIEFYAKMGKIAVAQSHLAYIKNQENFQKLHNYAQEINRLERICLVENETEENKEAEVEIPAPENHRLSMYNDIF